MSLKQKCAKSYCTEAKHILSGVIRADTSDYLHQGFGLPPIYGWIVHQTDICDFPRHRMIPVACKLAWYVRRIMET